MEGDGPGEEQHAPPASEEPAHEQEPQTIVGHFLDQSSFLAPGFSAYFNNPMFSDVVILAPDERRLHCHQVVLSAGSRRFRKLLEKGILQEDPELPVWGVDSDALETVLRCFYTGECHLTAANVVAVYDAAKRLEVGPLADFCNAFLAEVLRVSSFIQLLKQASHFHMEDMVKRILEFSETCLSEVIATEAFLTADFSLVQKLLSHNAGKSDNGVVLRAGWEWLVADSARNRHAADIAKVVPLPEGLKHTDLLNKETADSHGIVWRQQLILPLAQSTPPPQTSADPNGHAAAQQAAGNGNQPSLDSVLQQEPNIPTIQTQPPQPSSLLASALILPQLPLMLPPLSGANPADAAGAGGVATHPALPPLSSSAAGAGGGAAWPAGTLATDLLAQLGNGNNGFGNGFGGGFGFGDGGLMGRGTDDEDPMSSSYGGGANSSGRAARSGSAGRGAIGRGVCQVEGCNTDLGNLRDYHQRYKICEYHLKIPSVIKDGIPQRFCQQCGRFQALTEFDGAKRSCKARLQRHNDRRRKRLEEEPSGGYYSNTNSGKKANRNNGTNEDGYAAAAADDAPALPLPTGPLGGMAGVAGVAGDLAAWAVGAGEGVGIAGMSLTSLLNLPRLPTGL